MRWPRAGSSSTASGRPCLSLSGWMAGGRTAGMRPGGVGLMGTLVVSPLGALSEPRKGSKRKQKKHAKYSWAEWAFSRAHVVFQSKPLAVCWYVLRVYAYGVES